MANTDPNTKEKFDIWQEQGKEIVDIYKNDIDQLRQVLDAWVDLGFNKFNSFLAPQLDDFKQAILDTYDTYKDIADRTSQFAKTAHEAFENWNENGGGGSGGGSTPTPTDPNNPGGGGTSPGGTSPGGTTPGGGGTSPGGTTPGGGGTSPNGHQPPYNPTRPGMHDPLALDMNQDGQISTISLADSQVYFDLTGDGVKEKVGWIQAVDGLVAYDKNRNGTIDGISEVFGKEGISGFAELRQVADSNYDGIIDRRDELYAQLKVWQDLNQDGISQANELKTLSEAGVKNIELNVIGTNINLNGNLLSEAGRYGDSAGERELAADIQLLALEKVISNPNSTPPASIDPITELFPLLRGYGYVEDSFQAYNLDPNFKALTQRLMQDKNEVSSNFEEFIAYWSGFYTAAQAKGISHDEFSPKVFNMVPDIKMWILERFAGARVDAWRSEAHWPESLNGAYHHTTFQDEAYINEQFEALVDRFRAVFSVQAFYSDVFSDVHYDITIDEFVIDDSAAFTTKLTDYFNAATVNESDKLYLASTISVLEGIFLHIDGKAVIDTIENTTLRNKIFDIRNNVGRFEMANGSGIYLHDGTSVYGTVSNDKLVINSNITLSMTADKGDDIIQENKGGNTTYIFRKGDGKDTIIDMGGVDTLLFTDMLQSDIIVGASGTNLIIGRAEAGKTFDDLTDKVTLVNWANSANRTETIHFSDGNSLDVTQIIHDYFIGSGDDRLDLTSSADTINSLGGNDVIHGLNGNDSLSGGAGNDTLYGDAGDDTLRGDIGNDALIGGEGNDTLQGGAGSDTLDGGSGNDTYLYNVGDGHDIISDGSGSDTLRFGEGITAESLIVRMIGADMIIALREDGKTFEELSDTIMIKGWNNLSNRIEQILMSDGTPINLDALQIGTEGDDTFIFGNSGVNFDALGGNDTVTSGSGNDVIDGGTGNDTINAGNGANQIAGGEGNDAITTGSGVDTLSGGEGDDTLSSGSGNDILNGATGDDTLIAGEGNDTLSGGTGVDTLQGGMGDDLYLFNRGDGKDTIIDEYRYGYNGSNQSNAGNDTLTFGETIAVEDLIARVVGDDLILALKEDGKTFDELSDVITIKNWVNTANRIETIALSDGSVVDLAAIQSATEGNDNLIYGDNGVNIDALAGDDTLITGASADTLHGGDGHDTLRSGGGNDTLTGDGGNDTLIAGIGNDALSGGEGDDTLHGENGNDTLAGNAGNDTLIGGLGDDTYLFNLGDGRDVIIDEYTYGSGGADTLRFGEGITKAGLVARAVSGSNDLQIGVRESGKGFDALSDVVTLKNWFDANKRIENITLFDGSVVSLSEMQGGTDGDDYLVFGDSDTVIDAMGGNDTVISANGNDTLGGGAGNDTLISNNGNDTLDGGEGNDTLKAGADNDIISGGVGVDTLDGGIGDDTYIFGRGDGKDRIVDSAGNDTIKFSDGITKDDLVARFVSGSDDLQIGISEVGKTFDQLSDIITISGWRNAAYRVENLRLSDGTAVALTQIERSSEGDDYLVFGDEGVIVDALGGNDTLISGEGADTLKGGAGNDTILSGKGNDTLSGDTGSDTLKGGSGNDTYTFKRGDGMDNVFDEFGTDILAFGEGNTKNDLIFKQQGNNLLIGIAEMNKTFDQLSDVTTLTDWFKTESNIESLLFADGSSMNQGEIASLFVANDIHGALYSKPGAIMYGGSGDNTYVYNRGDFAVVIDDQYQQGQIEVNAGNDTLYLSGGINKSDVTFGVVGNDLILKVAPKVETYEQLRDYVVIKNWANVNRGVEKVIFSNGEMVTIDKSTAYPATTFNYGWVSSQYFIYGDDVNTVTGSAVDETFETNGGNDTINSGGGNDRINAGAGNDTIEGGAGNDVITMGEGDDSVSDSAGNDVYKYNKGDGKDTIYDLSGTDILLLGEGITQEDLIVKQVGSNLVVGIRDGDKSFDELQDKVTLKNWFYLNNKMENFQLFDGQTFNPSELISTTPIDTVNQYSMQFNGSSAMSFMNLEEARQIKNNFSFGAWIKVSATHEIDQESSSGVNGVWNQHYAFEPTYGGHSTAYGYLGAGLSVGTNGISVYEHCGWYLPATAVYSGNIGTEFNHIMVVYENKIPHIYLNGALVHTGRESILSNVFSPYIAGGMNPYGYINGFMDEIQVYNRTLSADEVMSLKNGSIITDGLVTYYDFEGNDPMVDKSGNGHIGVVAIGNPQISTVIPNTYSPPLILDLNANGKTSVSLTDSHTYFDYAADGLKEHTAWIEKGDALLVRDINNDGVINDGSELFGDKTKLSDGSLASDGYAALSQYDTNSDGVIDKNDTDFSQLKLWKDANQNGKTDASELVDLSVAGVTSLSLNRADGSVYTQSTENGNIVTNETNYSTLTDTGTMRDVWFKIDATDTITDNDTIYGTSESETLSGDFGNDTYVIAYGGGVDVIDDNGNGADTFKFLSGITADRLIIQWVRGTDDLRIGIRENAEDDTPITELSNTITIKNWFNESGAIEQFSFSDGTTLDRQGIYDLLLNVEGDLTMRVLEAGDTLSGNSGNDVLYGVEGNELLNAKEGDDYLRGLGGDDYLSGGAGDDTLEGGEGNDTLEGGIGDDYYLFDKGDGKDLIIDAGGVDTLYFGSGIESRDVIINEVGEDLILTFGYDVDKSIEDIDQITIKNWTTNDFKIESLSFSDGKEYSISELIEKNTNHAPEMFFEEGERNLGKERSAKGILLADDIDGDTLTYTVTSAPTMGTISINQYGIWTYTGTSRDAGTDTVTIAIQDGRGGEVTTTLSFVMEALNQAPEAPAEISNTLLDIRLLSGEVGATDIDGDVLTYTVSTEASHGTLSIDANGAWSYSAADGYMGTDSAVITIDDSNGGMITQTLNFDIKVSAPTLSDSTSGLLEDTSSNGVFNVTNPIGGALTYEVLNASNKGSFSVNEAGEWNYVPDADLNGSDSVMIKVTNAYGLSTTATLNLAIEAVNDIPVVTESITLNTVAEDSGVITITTEQLLASSYDVDGDILSVSNLSASAGTLVDNLDGTWSLTPDLDYNGTITLDYTVSDTKANAAATAIQIVTAVNDAPILIETPSPITLDAGTSTTGMIKASDVDGDQLSYRITSTPAHGELSINGNGEWSYNAERYYAGESSATISIDDGHSESITTTLNFTNLMTPDWHYTYSGQNMNINDNDGVDVLLMNDISMANLTFLQEGNNLRIDVQDKEDVILEDYFTSPTQGVESLQTSDGVINLSKERIGSSGSFFGIKWGSDNNDLISGSDTQSDILFGHNGNDILLGKGRSDLLYGNGGNDLLIGGESNDTLSGESGGDILYGDNGNDTLIGGEGNDKLFGGKGNDVLEGGAGNDLLHGGEGTNTLIGSIGDNIYLMSKGANTTTINENVFGFNLFGHYFGENGGNDTIQFDKGITKEDISFLMRGNDLLLQYGDSEFITINNQKNQANKIERLQLDDGNYLSNTDIDQIVQQINAYSKDHGFHLKDNTQIQNNQALMNIIASGWHQ